MAKAFTDIEQSKKLAFTQSRGNERFVKVRAKLGG